MSLLLQGNEERLALAAIGRLRQSARIYRERAAAATASEARRLIALSHAQEEEAARLEVQMILARPIETTGG